jgi:biotin carboxylase
VVVGVGSADPVGVVRLGEWLRAALDQTPRAAVHVVVNRAPAARARRAEIAQEIQRDGRVSGLTFAPSDARVGEAAWSASLVDRGPFARAMEKLRQAVASDLAPARAREPIAYRSVDVG